MLNGRHVEIAWSTVHCDVAWPSTSIGIVAMHGQQLVAVSIGKLNSSHLAYLAYESRLSKCWKF
jgi:hypothetical protein